MAIALTAALCSLAIVACSRTLPPASDAPRLGARVPDFTLTDDLGHSVTLSSLRGRRTVLVFYRGFW